jgi:hypothetical protein
MANLTTVIIRNGVVGSCVLINFYKFFILNNSTEFHIAVYRTRSVFTLQQIRAASGYILQILEAIVMKSKYSDFEESCQRRASNK